MRGGSRRPGLERDRRSQTPLITTTESGYVEGEQDGARWGLGRAKHLRRDEGTQRGRRDAKGGQAMPNTEKAPNMRRKWDPPTKHQRKQLAEIKRRTGMPMPEGITFELARQIIDASPVFAQERRARRAA